MSKYYLVAKSKTSDKFEIVKIKGNELITTLHSTGEVKTEIME